LKALWIVREIDNLECSSYKLSTIALSYELVHSYSEDAIDLSRNDIKDGLRLAKPDLSEQSVRVIAGQIYRFSHEIKKGDFVITPIRGKDTALLGSIVGDYTFDPKYAANFRPDLPRGYKAHTRRIKWSKKVSLFEFSGAFQRMLSHSQQTVFKPKESARNRLEEFLEVLQSNS